MNGLTDIPLRAALVGAGLLVSAQSSCGASPMNMRADPAAAQASEAPSSQDVQLQNRVLSALQADPYFYEAHMNVLVQHGDVVLRGFVFSDWDLQRAIRIATKAAQGARVIDDLTIEVGGRR